MKLSQFTVVCEQLPEKGPTPAVQYLVPWVDSD